MAVRWEAFRDRSALCPSTRAFMMFTTTPNEYAARFHDRMPVVLAAAEVEAWLGDEPIPDARLLDLCRGLPADALLHEALPPKLKITRPATHAAADEQKSPVADSQEELSRTVISIQALKSAHILAWRRGSLPERIDPD